LYPITVAGAVSGSHGLPGTLNLKDKLSKRFYSGMEEKFSQEKKPEKTLGWA